MRIPPWDYFTSFRARKMNIPYMKRELLWYANGDKFDDSIEQYADLWKKIKTADGSFNSNYGVYLWGEGQLQWCIDSLTKDKYSRQAVVQLLNKSHQYEGNPDYVCTRSMQWLIRDDQLLLNVSMRSNDAIFGVTNDCFCFGMIHVYMWLKLKEVYPELMLGDYTHDVVSMHVYSRHYKMLDELVSSGTYGYMPVGMPHPKSAEDFESLFNYGLGNDSHFSNWMLDHAKTK